MVVLRPQLKHSHHSLLTETLWSGYNRSFFLCRLSRCCSPPSLEHDFGEDHGNLWQQAHLGKAATPTWFGHKENKWFTPRYIITVNEGGASLIEAYVLLFADDVLLFPTDPELLTRFVSHLFSFITTSLQGPPNYSTYAGLHSNQILTVKVCPSEQTPYFVKLPLRLSRSKTLWPTVSDAVLFRSSFPLCTLSWVFLLFLSILGHKLSSVTFHLHSLLLVFCFCSVTS